MCLWQCSTPEIICWKKRRASSSDSRPRSTMKSNSSPPDDTSVTTYTSVVVSITSYSWMMWGWASILRMRISRLTFSSMSSDLIFSRLRILIATRLPVGSCSASLTLPNDPMPRVLPTL